MSASREFTKTRALVLAGLVVGYAALYLCRLNLAASVASLDSDLGIDKRAYGQIASIGTLAYAFGKVASGPTAERFGGKFAFFFAIFGSALACAILSQTAQVGLWVFVGLWMVSRAVQAIGWAGLVAIVPAWTEPVRYGTVMGWMSLSYQIGGVVVPVLFAALLAYGFGWSGLFLIPAILLGVIGAVLLPIIQQSPAKGGLLPAQLPADLRPVALPLPSAQDPHAKAEPEPVVAKQSGIILLLKNRRFWLVLALSFALTLLRECFQTWLPAYFASLGAKGSDAVLKSTLFPLLGCAGTIGAGWVSDKMTPGNRGPVLVGLLTGLVVVLASLAYAEPIALALGVAPADLALWLTAAAGLFVLAPYSMVGGGVIALDFGGQQSGAAAAGLLDAVGYLGASLAGIGVAETVARLGWNAAWQGLAGLSFGALLLCLPMLKQQPKSTAPSLA